MSKHVAAQKGAGFKGTAIETHNNLVSLFRARAAVRGDMPFLWAKKAGAWTSISWAEAERQVAALAHSLRQIGLKPGERVALVAENRPEWCIADMAIMAAGCVTVPAYTTNTAADHRHILDNSEARAVIVSNEKLAKPLIDAVQTAGNVDHVIGIDDFKMAQASGFDFHRWSALIADASNEQREAAFAVLDETTASMQRSSLACLIYTSGTGGVPRGVMQSHGAILHNIEGAGQVLIDDFGWGDEVFLSFLPLSHAYEHSGGQFLPIAMGGQIYYSEGLDKLASNIEETRPTIMFVVPRLFEVLRARIIKAVEKQGKLPNTLMATALSVGQRELDGRGRMLDGPKRFVLEKLFKPKIRARFGGQMKAMISGGAPLNPDIGVFFHSMGLTLLQGYGQTESGPVISCNRPATGIKMDTVGPPLMNTEVKIADDGEILVRGELVMLGYWRNQPETDKTIIDGWLHTGDIGHIDEAGRIVITDRKKDIIVNDKGDNVAPQRVEGMLTLQPEIAQAMVAGDRKPYISGLIVPDAEWASDWARAQGIKYDLAALQESAEFRAAVRAAVDRVNTQLSVIEKVRRFEFADEPFSIENGEMTPSLKIRRHKIRERYADRFAGMYKD